MAGNVLEAHLYAILFVETDESFQGWNFVTMDQVPILSHIQLQDASIIVKVQTLDGK